MNRIPEILNNPVNRSFNLVELEIYNLKEALELIEIEKISFSIFVIWSAVLSNLQRRAEAFDIETFTSLLKNRENYNANGPTLKERWIDVNEYELVEIAFKMTIIDKVTASLIKTLYWMKSSANTKKNFQKEEIFALCYLLEQNLFLSEFKIDKRHKSEEKENPLKRRQEDYKEETKVSTTHQELALKNGMKHFQESLITNNKNDTLLSAYI